MNIAFRRVLGVFLAVLPVALAQANQGYAQGITFTCTPGPTCGPWQRSDVMLTWSVDVPAPHSTEGCDAVLFKNEGTSSRTCRAFDGATEFARTTATVQIDKTAPLMSNVIPSTSPNALGWHTASVVFTFSGIDSSPATTTSGIAGCSQVAYSGPDTSAASIQGTCRDRAGNVSSPLTHSFKYDGTPPALAPLATEVDDRVVTLRWVRSEVPVEIVRTPGIGDEATSILYRGPAESFTDSKVKNAVTYQYRATVTDAAGHVATQVIGARPFRGFFAPAHGARVTAAPRLAWTDIRNADYYNIQLYRGSKKILSVWPKTPAYALKPGWQYQGTRFKLTPGAYRVYIWPGFGAVAKQRYGRIVGSRTFVVRTR